MREKVAELKLKNELEKSMNETADLGVDMLAGYWGMRLGMMKGQMAAYMSQIYQQYNIAEAMKQQAVIQEQLKVHEIEADQWKKQRVENDLYWKQQAEGDKAVMKAQADEATKLANKQASNWNKVPALDKFIVHVDSVKNEVTTTSVVKNEQGKALYSFKLDANN